MAGHGRQHMQTRLPVTCAAFVTGTHQGKRQDRAAGERTHDPCQGAALAADAEKGQPVAQNGRHDCQQTSGKDKSNRGQPQRERVALVVRVAVCAASSVTDVQELHGVGWWGLNGWRQVQLLQLWRRSNTHLVAVVRGDEAKRESCSGQVGCLRGTSGDCMEEDVCGGMGTAATDRTRWYGLRRTAGRVDPRAKEVHWLGRGATIGI